MSDSIEKRFCFDVISDNFVTYTLQALSDEDRKLWLEAMEAISSANKANNQNHILGNHNDLGSSLREEYVLDLYGLEFIKQLIKHIEKHGLEDQGIYRVSGVSSKITKLMRVYQENYKNFITLNSDYNYASTDASYLDESKIIASVENIVREFSTHELKTVTSALKNYLRNLPEPLMSFRLHSAFINAAKIEQKEKRINAIHELVHNLPKINFQMCSAIIEHLHKIAERSDKNLMSICNLGVCFGPTLLRPEEESVAAIMNIKFCNVVVEILIENYDKIFNTKPVNLNSKPQSMLSNYHNNGLPINNLPTAIGLPQQHPLQHQQSTEFNPNSSNNNRLTTSTLHQPQSQHQFSFRQAPHLIQQQQQTATLNNFNSLNNLNNLNNFNNLNNLNNISMPNHLNHIPPPTQQSQVLYSPPAHLINENKNFNNFNSFNRPVAGLYNNWNSNLSAQNQNLIETNYQLSNSYMPSFNTNHSLHAVPAAVQQNSISSLSSSSTTNHSQQIQQSPTLPRTNQSSNFYVSYNPNSNCNLSNNSGNTTTNSSNSNLFTSKSNSLSNNNLLNSIKNLTIDVNQPATNNVSSSSSSSSALSINLSQSLSKSNTALNNADNLSGRVVNTTASSTAATTAQGQGKGRTVKSLYACVGGSSSELSFSPNTIIYNVYPSTEPGWLRGRLENGQTGLIPSNYVKYIDEQ